MHGGTHVSCARTARLRSSGLTGSITGTAALLSAMPSAEQRSQSRVMAPAHGSRAHELTQRSAHELPADGDLYSYLCASAQIVARSSWHLGRAHRITISGGAPRMTVKDAHRRSSSWVCSEAQERRCHMARPLDLPGALHPERASADHGGASFLAECVSSLHACARACMRISRRRILLGRVRLGGEDEEVRRGALHEEGRRRDRAERQRERRHP